MNILHGVWLLMQASPIFVVLVPFGAALFVIMTADLVTSLRGGGSMFDPPAVILIRSHLTTVDLMNEYAREKRPDEFVAVKRENME